MFGPDWEQSIAQSLRKRQQTTFFEDDTHHGIIPRTIQQLFNSIQESNFTIYCSFIQIYNEQLFDLLTDAKSERPLVI